MKHCIPLMLLALLVLPVQASGFGFSRRPVPAPSYYLVPTYYAAPAVYAPPVICVPPPVSVVPQVVIPAPSPFPVPPPSVEIAPPPPVSPPPFAPPEPAPPSSEDQQPPIPAPSSPITSVSTFKPTHTQTRTSFSIHPSKTRGRAEGTNVIEVSFWNLTNQPLRLRIDGQQRTLAGGSQIILPLPRTFVWQVEGRTSEVSRIPSGENGLTILIRR